jgi:3-hydroxyisobutyrate dehydrogenase-like beta-hydroxyacid dehydrogenase
MATVLMTWELGGGLGHTTLLAPIAKRLLKRGHRVVAALRDLSRAEAVMGRIGVELLQAPVKTRRRVDGVRLPHTFAHILDHVGFADAQELSGMVQAWGNLYSMIRPDLIVFDHSPTAMVAARGFAARRVAIGTGFTCPTDEYPLPNLRTSRRPDPDKLRADENRILQQVLWRSPR